MNDQTTCGASRLPILGSLVFVAACGGGRSPGSPAAPQNLSYARQWALYTLDAAIAANLPSVTGSVSSWSITPPLPAGLTLNAASGALEGAPSALSSLGEYVVRAANSTGFTEATLRLGVVRPAAQALVCNVTDNSLSSFVAAGDGGEWIATGYEPAPEFAVGPRALAAHPSGRWAYVGQFNSRHISRFELELTSGRARALDNVVTAGRAEEIALHPSGEALHLFSRQSPHIETFAVNPLDGALSSLGTANLPANGLEAVAASADGRFLWASSVSTGNQSIATLEVDALTYLPALVGAPLPTTNKVRALALAPGGRTLYGASFESPTSTVDVFTVDPASGALSKLDSVTVGAFAVALAVEPTGRFLYVSISSDDTLRVFEIDPLDGRLSVPSAPEVATAPTGERPAALSISSNGERLAVTELDGFEVGVYSIDPHSGGLTRLTSRRTREQPQLMTFVERDQAAQPHTPFVYVGNATSGDVSIFATAPITGELSVVEAGLPVGGQPAMLARHPRGRWMYAADATNGVARGYAIDPATGQLAPIGPTVGAGLQPVAALVDPSGRFLYVANVGSSNLSVFAINPINGFLAQSTQHLAGGVPMAIEIDPSGRFLVTALQASSALNVFEIDVDNGALTALGAPFAFSGQPSALCMHPSGRFVFATAADTGELWALSLAALDGALAGLHSTNVGVQGKALSVHPRGEWLFTAVGGPGAGAVAFCEFDEAALTLSAATSASAGAQPADLAVEPGGAALYLVNSGSNNVTLMHIDPLSGVPSAVSAIPAGVGPSSIELLPRFN